MYAAEQAAEHPDKPALVFAPSGEVTDVRRVRDRSQPGGPRLPRERTPRATTSRSSWRTIQTLIHGQAGAERTGLYYTPVNSYLSAEEVAYILNNSESTVVVTSASKAEVAGSFPAVPQCRALADGRRSNPADPFESWEEATGRRPPSHVPDERLGTPMLYSSGTTGRPKGILRPLRHPPIGDELRLLGITALWRYRKGMVYLSPAPLYHAAPQMSIAMTLRIGSTCGDGAL